MRCQSYTGPVYIDFNRGQLGNTVGVPLAILVGATIIANLIVAKSKISEDSVFKFLVSVAGVFGTFAIIASIKWLFQIWTYLN